MRKGNREIWEKIAIIIIGIASFLGPATIATLLTGQSPIDAFSWLMWVTGGLAAVILAGAAAGIIIYIYLQQRE
ncbi:MAG: hypothetical protein QXO71_04645 [Candidatus Jordarchaeaceae archaeon]